MSAIKDSYFAYKAYLCDKINLYKYIVKLYLINL